jgi:hypothetical protein
MDHVRPSFRREVQTLYTRVYHDAVVQSPHSSDRERISASIRNCFDQPTRIIIRDSFQASGRATSRTSLVSLRPKSGEPVARDTCLTSANW